MDIIVVFGSVTSAAYQHLRLAMMRQGLKPKIVRFDKERQYESFSAFIGDVMFGASKHGIDIDSDDPHVDYLIEQAAEELANKCFSQVFESNEMVDSVKAVIFPPTLGYDDTRWLWVTERFPDGYAEYTAHESEDGGSPWLWGDGFGSSLPNIEADIN